MDFFQIIVKELKNGGFEARPDFVVGRCKDLMVRAKNFYAIYDEATGLWSTDEYDVQRLVDAELVAFKEKNPEVRKTHFMRSFSSNGQSQFRKYMSQISDNSHQLDNKIVFADTPVKKTDYISKRLPYSMAPGNFGAWDEMMGQLYVPEERAKIEWAFGAILSGDSKKIQKFLVLYGNPGTGKGTVIDVAIMLFEGYYTTFVAKDLGSNNNRFAAAAFAGNPLVGLQHDGDLSRIEDNTVLNSIVSHEIMKVDEKYKPQYDAKINAFLIMGTNKPVKITDAQSGLIRRLIDVHPAGRPFSPEYYQKLKDRLPFELGAIAHHCLEVYKKMGPNYYSDYRPVQMMFQTDIFLNYVETYYDLFEKQDGVSLKQAFNLYKEFCEDTEIDPRQRLPMYKVRAELQNYFEDFDDKIEIDGVMVRSYYSRFKSNHYKAPVPTNPKVFKLVIEETTSLLDNELEGCLAQYSKSDGTPSKYWDDSERVINGEIKKPPPHQVVRSFLRELDTHREHYVKPPENLVVIDFDLPGEDGQKSLERNLAEASSWPPTYAELSKSGEGVHLHYYYDGDIERLNSHFDNGIEVKLFRGNASLRRRLSKCNNVPIATISSGLPLKEKTRVFDPVTLKSEKALRDLIARNLRKEIHPGTKPSIDFIKHILDQAYANPDMSYDVSDLYQKVVLFANSSTNKHLECLKIVQTMKFKSHEDISVDVPTPSEDREVLFDIESYPNLFVICWKFREEPGVKPSVDNVIRMINPKPHEVEALLRLKLIGFNNRGYDNHMLWGAVMGFTPLQLNKLSRKIIGNVVGAKFGEAYKISWTDVYDYSTKKQGLKKWQIDLGLEHREMDIPWDQPVPEDRIMDVVDYCANDVISLEEVHNHLQGDYKARLILADLSGLSPNDTTAQHTAAIVFGSEKNPQRNFVYTKLAQEFPGYVFEGGKSTYRGEAVGEGGLVRSKPGLYRDVALLDVASMHPTSIGQLNLFGEYTPRYMALVEAQLLIKNLFKEEDFDGDALSRFGRAKELLGGKLRPYIEDIEKLKQIDAVAAKKAAADLRYGLKIAMNIVYGLTSAKFDNPFKDIRNVDNIVAKRGALFMIDLMHFVEEQGYTVAHIKTDSVKIPNATPEIIEQVKLFADKYGYDMEHEVTYAKLGLVNDAVYVAKKDECISNCWSATGSQYQHPYVFKKLFGYSDDINYNDFCETKHVLQSALCLDFGMHENGDGVAAWGTLDNSDDLILDEVEGGWVDRATAIMKKMKKTGISEVEQAKIYDRALENLIFVGKTGRFTPVKEGYGGGQLWRVKDGKAYAVQGTKGRLWVDSNVGLGLPAEAIDLDYFENLVTEAVANLEKFVEGSSFSTVDEFLS